MLLFSIYMAWRMVYSDLKVVLYRCVVVTILDPNLNINGVQLHLC